MLLKTRIRNYEPEQVKAITAFMLEKELAQNVSREQMYLTGDFVNPPTLFDKDAVATAIYVKRVKELNDRFNVQAEIVVG